MHEVVDIKNFLHSTRESGYRSLSFALAELVDNSVQAGAGTIAICLPKDEISAEYWEITVTDDGCGMEPETLQRCLAFGGSSRYDSRSGLGRFGMGLPNSSMSQARRVEVFSWCAKGNGSGVYLDIDEAMMSDLPSIGISADRPATHLHSNSGTQVRWTKLDRETPRSWSKEGEKISRQLGRMFRQVIESGLLITLNGCPIPALDPLLLSLGPPEALASPYGEPIMIDASGISGSKNRRSIVEVRFSSLDVHRLSGLNTAQKRALGIVGGAGVSLVRAGREIDYRWVFIGKRKENYDEWWRCQISFHPCLDEAFGVTNTKQGVRPTEALKRLLTPPITAVARVLNGRARAAHAEAAALRNQPTALAAQHVAKVLGHEAFVPTKRNSVITPSTMQISSRKLASTEFLITDTTEKRLVLNENHPFFRVFYEPLTAGVLSPEEAIRGIDLLLLALGHHRASSTSDLDSLLRLFFGKSK